MAVPSIFPFDDVGIFNFGVGKRWVGLNGNCLQYHHKCSYHTDNKYSTIATLLDSALNIFAISLCSIEKDLDF